MKENELEDWLYVKNKMNNEGFEYCFIHYSDFSEIKDEKFHELRKLYIKSAKKLKDYINNKCNENIEDE